MLNACFATDYVKNVYWTIIRIWMGVKNNLLPLFNGSKEAAKGHKTGGLTIEPFKREEKKEILGTRQDPPHNVLLWDTSQTPLCTHFSSAQGVNVEQM